MTGGCFQPSVIVFESLPRIFLKPPSVFSNNSIHGTLFIEAQSENTTNLLAHKYKG